MDDGVLEIGPAKLFQSVYKKRSGLSVGADSTVEL
jgi:hypothetical protein